MSLRYRLAFYLFGLTIGFYFVGEFLSAKVAAKGVTFCYFPNCRVIKDIRSKTVSNKPSSKCCINFN